MGKGACGRAACTLAPHTMMKATGASAVLDEQVWWVKVSKSCLGRVFELWTRFRIPKNSIAFAGVRETQIQLWSRTATPCFNEALRRWSQGWAKNWYGYSAIAMGPRSIIYKGRVDSRGLQNGEFDDKRKVFILFLVVALFLIAPSLIFVMQKW